MSIEKDISHNRKSGFLFILFYISAFILIPLFLLLSLLFTQLTCSYFYTSILRNADFIETYINAEKWHVEEKIKREIEDKVHLEKFRTLYVSIKAEYERKSEEFKKITRHDEYERLIKERDELSGLSYNRAPSHIHSPEDFTKFKETGLERIDKELNEIDVYRKNNKDIIKKTEDELEVLEDNYEEAEDTLKDKEEDARDIILSHKDSFEGRLFSDLRILSPILTEELNSKLIDKNVKFEIEKIINFFTDYFEQKNAGNIYTDRLDGFISGQEDNLNVRLPEISISLWVDDEVNGVMQKRHLLSQVFIDRIQKLKDLKNKNVFIKLFAFSESGLAEMIGRSFFKKMNVSIRDGIIRVNPGILTGENAKLTRLVMIILTFGKYLKFILPAIALLLFLPVIFSKKGNRYRRVKNILIYPSLLIICFFLGIFLFVNIMVISPEIVKSPLMQTYLRSLLNTTMIHVLGPGMLLFFILFFTGFLLRKKARVKY